ncbi:MAG TPA: amino acid adenylation domain-containing protein, partial [Thermoanaerobaculia bacterium]|nr:amino acid adenylation domain-containing protein [Thermoanaerobaculia bacterium]
SPFYNTPLALELLCSLSLPLLAASLDRSAARHEVLRTTYHLAEDRPVQVIAPELRLAPPRIDLDGLPEPLRAAEALRVTRQEAARPFDLSRGPIARAIVLRLEEDVHIALFNQHHIVSDGWSIGVLIDELADLYRAFATGRRPALPDLPIQYADYAVWQRSWLDGPVLEARLAWWRERLAGAPQVLELPTDRPRPAVQSLRGAHLGTVLPAGLSAALSSLSRERGATLFMTLSSLFSALLSRQSGATDLLLGTPIAGRNLPETERLLGLFVNTLVVRAELAGDPSFLEILGRMREMTLGAYAHQELPFERLVDSLQPERSLAHSPLFQVMLVLQNAPQHRLELPGLTLSPYPVESGTSRFDLLLNVNEADGVLLGDMEYSRDLFDPATILRLFGHLRTLAEGAVSCPEARLSELPLLSAPEIHQVRHEWNDTAAADPVLPLLALFAAQVEHAPNRPAAVLGSERWSYAELGSRAAALARRLRGLGAGVDSLVAVCLDRSLEMAAAVLGVLEAGAAVLPLDPAYPQPRLGFMLEDSEAPLLLTRQSLLPALPEPRARVLCLDEWPEEPSGSVGALPQAPPEALAYVIYTSGSTGRPKGTGLSRGALANLIHWQLRSAPLPPGARVLQLAPLSFDVSFQEMFSTWASGGTLVLVPEETRRDPGALLDLLAAHRVRRLFLPFVALQQLSEAAGRREVPRDLKEVRTAGEQLRITEAMAGFFSRLGPGVRLDNDYGPSETHVVTSFRLPGAPAGWPLLPPIGRPVGGSRVYVLDGSLCPVPAGVAGELYLGGRPVGRGYHRRPDLTAERFLPDPWSPEPGARLYRTGDLARWSPDAQLDFLGRIDAQVKVRGFRIEPGEIEAVLAQHPAVQEAAVVVRAGGDAGGDASERRLVAFWTPAGEAEAPASELRAFLAERLPEHMVPSVLLPLSAFPLTPSGKVDRRALAGLAPVETAGESADSAPRTPLEEIVTGVWAAVLGLDRVGAEQNFFDLGGHSLLATRVIARLSQACQVDFPIRALFEHPTARALAAALEREMRKGGAPPAPPIVRAGRDRELPLSFAQERMWFLDLIDIDTYTYNVTAALRLAGPLDVPRLAASFLEIFRRHEPLRTTFLLSPSGYPAQVIGPPPESVLAVVDLGALPAGRREQEAERMVGQAGMRPFDLKRGPVLRAALLRLGENDHALAMVAHHICADEWSIGIFVSEVSALYTAFLRGERPALPDLPLQYADFAVWQRSWLQGDVITAMVDAWKARLAGAPPALDVPTDRPRPALMTFNGFYTQGWIGREATAALHALARREGATLFMVALAGYQTLLHRQSGQDDFVIGSPIAGRNREEIEPMIGVFINMLVLRGDLSGRPSLRELVARGREVALEAYRLQDLPFEKLVEELNPERDLSRNPIFQVVLMLRNTPRGELSLPGLSASSMLAEIGTSKYELSLSLSEHLGGLGSHLEFNIDLFDRSTAARMLSQLGTLLAAAAQDPDRPVGDIPLLGAPERHQLLAEWNDTAEEVPAGWLYPLFAEQAERTPEAVAVVSGEERWTYRELHDRSARLARRLGALGVGPETRVGVCLERSPDLLAALLGTLGAGGAYVPLDPAYPAERLSYMLEDSGAALLLTEESLLPRVAGFAPRVLTVDAEWEGEEAPAPGGTAFADPGQLAYVIYTSGSTGRPKGVGITNRSAVALIRWARRTFPARDLEGVLAATSVCFDLSVFEIFVPLASGGKVILAAHALALPELPAAGEVTLVNTVPSAIAELARAGRVPASVRTVNLAGEPLKGSLVREVYARTRAEQVWNLYGPTEDTTYSTFRAVGRGAEPDIGRPLPGTRALVLDSELQPLPPGVPGGLYLGGAGLARGYLGRPALTAASFLPDPWSPEPGARLYATGDLARWRPDGSLEFLGRRDHQVKVRGFRIELGEVEAALAALPGVREAAVLALGEGIGRRLAAFVVPEGDGAPAAPELRRALRERLPEPLIPESWSFLPALPLTANGKVDRRALAQRESTPVPVAEALQAVSAEPPRTRMERLVAAAWCEVLGVSGVGRHDNFFDLGGHSLLLVRLQERLRVTLEREIFLLDLFRHPTVDALARFLSPGEEAPAAPLAAPRTLAGDSRIAIIGMAGRFPGADGVEELWRNLCGGVEGIVELSEEELLEAGVDPELLRHPSYVRAAAPLADVQHFDAEFFGYTPRDAEITDPQRRLFLEAAWEALENGGYDPRRFGGRVGVYAGVQMSSYIFHLHRNPEVLRSAGSFHVAMSNDKDHLPTTVSYKLNLRGPSLAVQTACSSSLVAAHLACRSLLGGECDMALAGGSSVLWPQIEGYLHQEGGIMSPDGHCRAFDARAEGTLRGSGVGVVLLKRLADALADGDTIHAVILGTAINNDGSGKIGYTAPSVEGQAQVIASALAESGVDPRTITYVEAHGSGTPLGDPIEVAALTQAFRAGGVRDTGFCALGSVKTNLGHLDTAGGVTGLIKTTLALEHGKLPPSLHFEEPNPQIDFAASPFFVNAELREWTSEGGPRRAGVSSFGLGGTNAHVVLEEAPPAEPSGESRPWQLLLLSARTPAALERATDNLAAHLEANPDQSLADVAYTLRAGRGLFAHRRAVAAATAPEAAEALRSRDSRRVATGLFQPGRRSVAFLLPGVGDQYPGMARELYDEEPVFRQEIDLCAELLRPHLGLDLREALFAAEEARDLRALLGRSGGEDSAARSLLRETRVAQPAMFAVGYALARLWMSWGVTPQALLGYSLGELTAACLAGVMELKDALALAARRARLISELAPGAMLAVPLSEEETRARLVPELSLAAVNAPEVSVVAGPPGAVAAFESRLAEEGLPARRLQTDQAFHSWMLEPAAGELLSLVRSIRLAPPRIPWLSNVTGTWIEPGEATDPAYWARHLVSTVRFADALAELWREPGRILLEMGPGQTLGSLALQQIPEDGAEDRAVLSALRHELDRQPDQRFLLQSLGRLWLAGADVDWSAFDGGERRRRVPLPTYPFERQRFWIDPAEIAPPAREATSGAGPGAFANRWLVLLDPAGVGDRLAQGLAEAGAEVATARVGPAFSRLAPGSYTLDPHAEGGFDELFADWGAVPGHVVHLWSLDAPEEPSDASEELARGYRTLIALSRALARREERDPVDLCVVASGLNDFEGEAPLHAEKAALLGPLRGIPRKHPEVSCRLIDAEASGIGTELETRLLAELTGRTAGPAASRPGPREEPAPSPGRKGRRPALPVPWAAPSTATEAAVAALWEDLLGIDPIGAHDDFFALGGHSLLGLQLVSRIQAGLGVELPLQALFEAPTVEGFAARIEAEREAGEGPRIPPLVPVPREGPLPLSFAQQRLWFIDQLEPGTPIYNMPVALRVEGPLAPRILALCLGEIVRRHETLRTAFAPRDGSPVQVIREAAPFRLPVVDLSGLPESEREALALTLTGEEALRPFDLTRGPLLRGVLLRMAPRGGQMDHVAALTLHHIASDGWSMGILVRETVALYEAFAAGKPSPLPELPVQYADFSAWQQSWLHGETLEAEIAFWRRQLAGLPPLLTLPTDRPRPAVQSFRGAYRPVRLPAELTRQLQLLSQSEGATLFMALLAGFQALLARHSGQDDLAVGTPVAGRRRVELEGLIGFFVNTLVLRGDLAGEPSFRELLGRARAASLAAHAHQDVPFERLVQELSPERSLAQTPLFQAMLVLQNTPVESLEIENLRFRPVNGTGGTSKFDLTLILEERDGEVHGAVEHAAGLFDAATIDRLIAHFERLLTAAAATPDAPVSAISLLSPAERGQILVEWNDTGAASGPPACLHELFEAQARRTPDAVAVIAGTREVRYAELDEQAGRLAGSLRAEGAGPEAVVGVCLERSADMVAALLAVLKAGAAYLPLDPRLPRPRLAGLLESARASLVVSDSRLADALPWSGPRVLVDRETGRGSGPPSPGADPGNLAYVLYTSGSTGTPKGVAVTHRSAVELVRWARTVYAPEELAGVLAATSLSFDLSVFELFVPLSWGGTVILAQNALELPALPAAGRVTLVNTVPSAMSELVREGSLGPSVRTVNLAGEPLPRSLADRIHATGTVERLWNLYGPSEDTTYSTFARIDRESSEAPGIGRPVAATRAYVLAGGMEPVPVGVPGELCLAGAGLARGYLHRPDLTAERFLPDPFAAEPGARTYRTGDLVRWRPGGSLDFLGRLDHQVKIRGFRIEPGEIEAALAALPGVREAVVTVREDTPGERRLVAYVAGDATADELRRSLREELPDYMVPAAFVTLAALPLTPNGKVDRKALPAPELPGPEGSYLAPRTPVEEILAGLWAEILGLERIGAHDRFFDLGGHSLLATRVLSRLQSAFDVEMPLRDLFEAPRLTDFAARVEAARRAGTGRLTPPLVPVPREGPMPLSFAQQRLWFLQQMDPASPAYNMPFGFRLSGPLAVPALAAGLTGVVRRHETLRTALIVVDGEPRQSIAPAAPQPLPLVDLSALPAQSREEVATELGREEAARPFDLARLPVVRTLLLRLDERDHVLFFTIHHVTGDGWSIEVLSRELVALYGAAAAGLPSRLPELPVQYADFAVWQRSWLKDEVFAEQIDYWRHQLAGAPALLEMPLDRPRPPVQSFRGGRCRLHVPADSAASLFRLGRSREATGFMTVLAGFQALLHRYSGQESVVVGTPVANRERAELEGMIGFFANTLAMRADFTGDPGFSGLLARVREAALGAYGHQDLPFEKLVDELAPRRDLSYAPVFQVLFVYQNAPLQATAALSELTLQPFGADEGVARFDLTLVCTEVASGLGLHLDYNADLFEESTARLLLRLFGHFLERAAAEPERPVSELPLLDEEELRQAVLAGHETARPRAGEELGLYGLFARQAALTPEAPAVVAPDGVVRYGELALWAGRIAERLERLGLGAEDRVGVCLERSAAALAALLGALQAGAAYVPLDPEWPRERLAAVAADAGLAAVLTRAGLGSGLAPHEVLVPELRQGPPAGLRPARPGSPDAAAYVIYTSGSTGAAKGVIATHRGAANFVLGIAGTLGLGAADRLLLFAPLSFDASVLQIFPPLASGASLVVHPNPRELTAGDILDLCERHSVTVLDLPAALWRQWVEEVAAARRPLPAGLRAFLTGGESVPVARLRTWAALTSRPAAFLSSYGPTEATVTTTVWQTTSGEAAALQAAHVPIGRPLPNARVCVLDRKLQPVPRGVAGELFLGGAGLARGYLGRADLTAEAFVPDPLSGEPGARLYRTGDLGRHRPDGDLEFLGRADHQVKIRGFRIEPGEIEVALARFPEVRQAVVTVREDVPGISRLVGYVLPRDGGPIDPAKLRAFLAERLPAYMVPGAFVTLDELPVLPSGKVDRAALPPPADERSVSFVAPRDPLEQVLAEILGQVLKVETVGAFDHFFELGGDSLTAAQAVARIREAFDIDFQLRSLFEEPTVAGLASVLRLSDDGAKVEETAALRVELAGLSDEEVEARLLAEATAEEGFPS